MATSILSSSSLQLTRLISTTFKSPISYGRRMMTTTTVSGGPSPCLMLPPTLEGFGGNIIYNFYNLAQNKVINFNQNQKPEKGSKIVGSSHGWLALYNERNSNLILTNPVTRRHVNLPPSEDVSKVIISCDPEQDECQAMKIGESHRLAFCRPDQRPTEWTTIGALRQRPPNEHYQRSYEDVVYSSRHKLFFCNTRLFRGDDLEGWDVVSNPPRLRWENRDDLLHEKYHDWLDEREERWFEMFKYLVFVEQTDLLFLVTRHFVRQMAPDGTSIKCSSDESCPYKTVEFDVHKIGWELDGEGGSLSHLNGGSLDGLTMFVGHNHSFAVSATEANGLKPNSIYFTDDRLLTPPERWLGKRSEHWLSKRFGGHDIGIFDYENKTISPCYYPCDLQSFKKIMPAPIWFTPTHY